MTRPLRSLPDARLREVIELVTSEGAGTEEEPVRFVVYYIDPQSGQILARYDGVTDADFRRERDE